MDLARFVDPESLEGVVVGDVPSAAGTILPNRTRAPAPPCIRARRRPRFGLDSEDLELYAHSGGIVGVTAVIGATSHDVLGDGRPYHCRGDEDVTSG